MHDEAIHIYVSADELFKALGIKDDPQSRMNNAEVVTFALLASNYFACNYRKARLILRHVKYFKYLLSESRLNRRLHNIPEVFWKALFEVLAVSKKAGQSDIYIVDSFPVKAYANYRSSRANIFTDQSCHGYCASKKEYFFGIKVHMIVSVEGVPIEFFIAPARESDVTVFQTFGFNLSAGVTLLADRAYTDYLMEDMLLEEQRIQLVSRRKTGLKRIHTPLNEYVLEKYRNRVETVFSAINSRFARYIHATTEKGFSLKVVLAILSTMCWYASGIA